MQGFYATCKDVVALVSYTLSGDLVTFDPLSGHGSETPTEALVNKMAVLKTSSPHIRVPN